MLFSSIAIGILAFPGRTRCQAITYPGTHHQGGQRTSQSDDFDHNVHTLFH